jgi:hypothetical protein
MRWHADRSIYNSLKAASLAEEVEASLRRSGRSHRPLPDSLAQSRGEIEEGWEALARLREQGKIRWIGVSNFNVEQMKRARRSRPSPACSRLTPCCAAPSRRRFFPFAGQRHRRHQLLAHAFRLLTGKMTAERVAATSPDDWRRKNVEFNEPRLSRNLRLVELLREIGNAHGVSPAWWPWPGRCTIQPLPRHCGRPQRKQVEEPRRAQLPAERRRGIRKDQRVSGYNAAVSLGRTRGRSKNPGRSRGFCLKRRRKIPITSLRQSREP